MSYCIYLRKSRADVGLSAKEDVLKRHETVLLELAKNRGYNIEKIFREVVSGETLLARPQMQQLLSEVEAGKWEGVLVMEVERLARGNSIDQGIVSQTFMLSDTLIITPNKIYNPANEFDEEYFEFGLFMSRREYKTINRRLNAGRLASAKEGKYVGSIPPYGFDKVKLMGQKGWRLIPIEEEAMVVKLIYDLYLSGDERTGFQGIANRLTDNMIPAKNGRWSAAQIRYILTNDVYIGKIHWQKTLEQKKSKDGLIVKARQTNPNCRSFEGIHDAIISSEIFEAVQSIIKQNKKAPNNYIKPLQNPFAGVLTCSVCGKSLKRRPADKRRPGHCASYACTTRGCPTIGCPADILEQRIITGISLWLDGCKIPRQTLTQKAYVNNSAIILSCKRQLKKTEEQLTHTYSLLEQGLYDKDTFLNRQSYLKGQISAITDKIKALEIQTNTYTESERLTIPNADCLSKLYSALPNAKAKNDLIKKLFSQIKYTKSVKGSRWEPEKTDCFELEFISYLPYLPKADLIL